MGRIFFISSKPKLAFLSNDLKDLSGGVNQKWVSNFPSDTVRVKLIALAVVKSIFGSWDTWLLGRASW